MTDFLYATGQRAPFTDKQPRRLQRLDEASAPAELKAAGFTVLPVTPLDQLGAK